MNFFKKKKNFNLDAILSAQKISIIGNSCGGKTTLSRLLQSKIRRPLIHVDSIQFLPGLKLRPFKESIEILNEIQSQRTWIIDGYGPLDLIEQRFASADLVIFIDLPLRTHIFWCLKRQCGIRYFPRKELPQNCQEGTLEHTKKLLRTIWKAHHQMRPELLKILNRDSLRTKVLHLKNKSELNQLLLNFRNLQAQ